MYEEIEYLIENLFISIVEDVKNISFQLLNEFDPVL